MIAFLRLRHCGASLPVAIVQETTDLCADPKKLLHQYQSAFFFLFLFLHISKTIRCSCSAQCIHHQSIWPSLNLAFTIDITIGIVFFIFFSISLGSRFIEIKAEGSNQTKWLASYQLTLHERKARCDEEKEFKKKDGMKLEEKRENKYKEKLLLLRLCSTKKTVSGPGLRALTHRVQQLATQPSRWDPGNYNISNPKRNNCHTGPKKSSPSFSGGNLEKKKTLSNCKKRNHDNNNTRGYYSIGSWKKKNITRINITQRGWRTLYRDGPDIGPPAEYYFPLTFGCLFRA